MMLSICRRLFSTFLILGLPLLLFPSESGAQDFDPADTLVFSHQSNVGPLNPHMYAPNEMYGQNMVYDALVVMSREGKILPSLAESWDVSPDGLTYTFHLRKDMKFSDGTPLDAKAVEMNFKAVMDNKDRHKWMGLVGFIKSFAATGPLDFQLLLTSPYYPTLEDLSTPRPFRMLSPAAFPDKGITADGIKAPIGSGPWKFAESVLGEYDLFEANENYWGPMPNYSKILVRIIVDPVSRGIAFETGELDLIFGMGQVNYEVYDRFSKMPGITAKTSGPMGTYAMAMNTGKSPTDELAVRQAVEYLTDRDSVAKAVSFGSLKPAGHYISPNMPYCDVGLAPYTFDAAKAASILDAAGWTLPAGKKVREKDGKELTIDYYFVGNRADQKTAAEIVQAQAAKVGVNLNILGEEEDSWRNRLQTGDFGMIAYPTYGPPNEPHSFMSIMRYPGFSDYQAQVGLAEKPEIDQAISDALSSVDPVKRQEAYKKVLTIFHEECVYLPLYYNALMAVYRADQFSAPLEFGNHRNNIPFETFKLNKKK
ncbi:MAG: nickel ABC transporter substrate-binding protein [Deltaproteobacteria bacterium]|jgi:nickel transport system substrate-binding protein|nr:nickel ABC transporter substrate-binding protein [Deltaproteobacteria bacterium]